VVGGRCGVSRQKPTTITRRKGDYDIWGGLSQRNPGQRGPPRSVPSQGGSASKKSGSVGPNMKERSVKSSPCGVPGGSCAAGVRKVKESNECSENPLYRDGRNRPKGKVLVVAKMCGRVMDEINGDPDGRVGYKKQTGRRSNKAERCSLWGGRERLNDGRLEENR